MDEPALQQVGFELLSGRWADAGIAHSIRETSNRVFGYVDEYEPYKVFYPWAAERLQSLKQGSHLLDLGAGISPMPILLAEMGFRVDTVDRSEIIRRLPADETWTGWGFFDYGSLHPALTSRNCNAEDFTPSRHYDGVYSIGMLAHLAQSARLPLFRKLESWCLPGAPVLFTVDVVKSTDWIWNRRDGLEIEPVERHGTVFSLLAEMQHAALEVVEAVLLRDVTDCVTDVMLIECRKP